MNKAPPNQPGRFACISVSNVRPPFDKRGAFLVTKIAGAGNPAASERALKLLNAFLKIPNQEVADKLFGLMMAFSKSSYMAKKQQQEDIDSRKQ